MSRSEEGAEWRATLESEKVWLVHSLGFSAGRLHRSADPQGRPVLRLDNGGEIQNVDETTIEKV